MKKQMRLNLGISLLLFIIAPAAFAELPAKYLELVPFVQPAPDQGDTNACQFVAMTGAVELLLNKRFGISNPKDGDPYDISERFAISHITDDSYSSWHTHSLPRFNYGWAIHQNNLPFRAYDRDGGNNDVWEVPRNFYQLPRMQIPMKFEEIRLFAYANRYITDILTPDHITEIKEALLEYRAPILINYNHQEWWHMVLIVGYDDSAHGSCFYTPKKECSGKGAFIVRDSDSEGKAHSLRDYGWFRYNGNAAFVIKVKGE